MDKIKIAGGEKATDSALYAFNRDLETTPDEATLAQDVTVEKP
jgi:ferritin